ncbi:MAG: class I SAM-dependent rRNA methyltransferase [Lachnospiraceae bacterium]|nr:class I SAM-dependent rRNA methyltransferase [Lachnospiraceae bacterium]
MKLWNEIDATKQLVGAGVVTLKKGEGRLLKSGGAWIFDNEIAEVSSGVKDGDIITLQDFDGFQLGYGFYNSASKIRVRMLARWEKDGITPQFLYERVRSAWEYRKKTVDTSSCRVIFSEADWVPGMVVDKYEDVLVVESLALGIDCLKEYLMAALLKVLEKDGIQIRGIFERSDAPVRKKEGMAPYKGWLWLRDEADNDVHVEICENGVKYLVDVENGQKTGFFLDQKYNRLAMQNYVKGARVLDCFTHMGTFALNAGRGGAKEVLGLDISEFAVEQARANAVRNGLDDVVKFQVADVLDELPKMEAAGRKFDVVILDPPAFTKSREATKRAIKGYREINMRGMKLVENGGILATCSCSHFMTEELFKKTIHEAATSVHKRLRQIEFRTQSPDHPILWSADESYYLKFLVFQVVDER